MHPDATDSSSAGLTGSPGERRPEPRQDAAAPVGPGGWSWRVPVAVAVLAAVSLSCLGPGCWLAAGGAGPGTVLLMLSLHLGCAAAAFLLGTLLSLVCRSRRAPPPDFAAAWRRLAAAACCRPGCLTTVTETTSCPGMEASAETRASSTTCSPRTSGKLPDSCATG